MFWCGRFFTRASSFFHFFPLLFNVPSRCCKFTRLKDILNQIYTYKIFTTLFFWLMLNYVLLTKSYQFNANYWREETNFDKQQKVTRFNYTFILQ